MGVVGAGIAGLAAARFLQKNGHTVTVWERDAEVGGRCETVRLDGYTLDTGVTSIAPRGRSIEKVMLSELSTEGLVHLAAPIYIHTGLRVSAGDPLKNRIVRYTYTAGNETLPMRLAEGLDIHLETEVSSLERSASGGFTVGGERYDALVIAVPALATVGDSRPLGRASYRKCLSVLLGYKRTLPPVAYHAIIDPEQRHPLTWLSLESAKCPGRAPEGCTAMVAQMSPQFSNEHFEAEDGGIVSAAADSIARLYGKDWESPAVFDVRRWLHSLPEGIVMFDHVNERGSRLVVAGDALLGGRVEYAFETGVMAANLLGEPE